MRNFNATNPKIYVVDVAASNAGRIRGVWLEVDGTQSVEELRSQIHSMLSESPEVVAETWVIHAYQDFYGSEEDLGSHPNLNDVIETAQLIAEHGELGGLVISHCCGLVDEAINVLENLYAGSYKSLADFASELSQNSVGNIPKNIARYIDYERMGNDMDLSGEIFTLTTSDNRLHIFWNS